MAKKSQQHGVDAAHSSDSDRSCGSPTPDRNDSPVVCASCVTLDVSEDTSATENSPITGTSGTVSLCQDYERPANCMPVDSSSGHRRALPTGTTMDDIDTERILASSGNTFLQKILKVCSKITLEPMLFLKMIAESNFKVVGDTLEIDRVCRVNLGYPAEECQVMDDGNHTQIQTDVQRYQNIFNYYQSLMDSLLPLAIILFMGSISDRFGRKIPLVLVIAGFVVLGSVYILQAVNSSWPVEVLLGGTLAVDLTGSWVVFNMAVYSYVADVTTHENRTKRMGVLDFCWYIGSPLGTLLGGWLYQIAGYVAVFTTSTVLWVICLIYTICLVKESRPPQVRTEEDTEGKCGPCVHVIALLRTGFKKRAGNGRAFLIILMIIKLAVFLVQGHQVYQWSRVILQWGPTEYSTWSTADSIIHQVGMVAWVWFAERVALHDCSTLIGGLVSVMMWSAILAAITSPQLWWFVIIASVLGMLEGSMEPSIRSLMTTVVGSGEAGRVLALMGLFEAAWFSVDSSIYTALYNSCIETFTQINFVVQASIALGLVPVVYILKTSMTKHACESGDKSL